MTSNRVFHDKPASIIFMRSVGMLACTLPTALPVAAQRTPKVRPPEPDKKNVVPTYPEMLHAAGIGGTVRVTFAVDSTGLPIISSFRMRKSDNDLFTVSVRDAVTNWRYTPA